MQTQNYTVKNFKTFRGHEGETCTMGKLYLGADRVVEWEDSTTGGGPIVSFASEAARVAFLEYAKTEVAKMKNYEGNPYDLATIGDWFVIEIMIGEISEAHEHEALLKRMVKTKIVFLEKDEKASRGVTIHSVAVPYTKANVEKFRVQVPNLLEVVNERFGMPYVSDSQAKISEENKRFRKLCKSVTLFSIQKPGEALKVMQNKMAYSEAMAKSLRARYGTELVEIINERYL